MSSGGQMSFEAIDYFVPKGDTLACLWIFTFSHYASSVEWFPKCAYGVRSYDRT